MTQKTKPHPVQCGLTDEIVRYVRGLVDEIMEHMHTEYPALDDVVILAALDQELERRGQLVIEWSCGK